MQMEGSFNKDGEANTCLCFKEKKRMKECILCYEAMSVINMHFDTKHVDKYAKFCLQEKQQSRY